MKRRVYMSFVAGLVYVATYAGILYARGEHIVPTELLIGFVAFVVVFFLMRTWLDHRRQRRMQATDTVSFKQDKT